MAPRSWAFVVPIVVTHPRHRERQGVLVAALRREVEVVVRADQQIEPARIGGVRVEDVAVLVLVEDAEARGFLARELAAGGVVVPPAPPPLLLSLRDGEIHG